MTRMLLAGDHFVQPDALAREIAAACPDARLEIIKLLLPWPLVPFGAVGEVDEASGSEQDLTAALQGVELCVTQMAPFTRAVIESSPDLKLICVTRGGPVNINLEAAREQGVSVCTAPGRNAVATAEHTMALMLAALRKIPMRHADIQSGEWRSDYYAFEAASFELNGATVGLVGYGAVGREVARMLNGFGANVLIYDPFASINTSEAVRQVVELPDLLATSNIISLHARLTPQTRHFIGAAEIGQLPRGAIIVNAARGALLDYDAVCDALESEQVAAAAFDVFPQEPLPAGSRLRTTPNIVMTPHLAGATKETALRAARIAAGQVSAFLGARPVPFAVP